MVIPSAHAGQGRGGRAEMRALELFTGVSCSGCSRCQPPQHLGHLCAPDEWSTSPALPRASAMAVVRPRDRPREVRERRLPNAIPPLVEEQVLAFALAHPGFGPLYQRRIGAREVGQPQPQRRLGDSYSAMASTPEISDCAWSPATQRHRHQLAPPPTGTPPQGRCPRDIVQLDCFCIGPLSGTEGATSTRPPTSSAPRPGPSGRASTKNPLARHTSALAHSVAQDLAARGWKVKKATPTALSSRVPNSSRGSAPSTSSFTPDVPRRPFRRG